MKKGLIKVALVAIAMVAAPLAANAQSNLLNGVLGTLKSKSSTVNAVTNIVGNLLGTNNVSESSLVGTWTYSQPSIAFESESVLGQVGASVASSKIQGKMKKGLEKAGIKSGKMTITFNQDKSFVFTVGNRQHKGTYKVDGCNLTLTFAMTGRTVTANVKQNLGSLQLAMKADKMLQVVNTVATKASAYSSQMGTVSALLGNYKGMYLGLEFTK